MKLLKMLLLKSVIMIISNQVGYQMTQNIFILILSEPMIKKNKLF